MYVVKWVKPKRRRFGKLTAITTDGIHGLSLCTFPDYWNNLSRFYLNNAGKMFLVSNVTWNDDGYYIVKQEDIIKEVIPNE